MSQFIGLYSAALNCGDPPLLDKGSIKYTTTTVNSTVYFECNMGYVINSTSGSLGARKAYNMLSLCNTDGRIPPMAFWTPLPTSCEGMCCLTFYLNKWFGNTYIIF